MISISNNNEIESHDSEMPNDGNLYVWNAETGNWEIFNIE